MVRMGDGCNFGIVDIKKKEIKTTKYRGVYRKVSQTQYLLNDVGYYGGICVLPTYFFDGKKNEYRLLARFCEDSVVSGENIYFMKSDKEVLCQPHTVDLCKYNIKSSKVVKVKSIDNFCLAQQMGTNFLVYKESTDGPMKIVNFGKATTKISDGIYKVSHDGDQKGYDAGIYKAKISNNKLTMYGNFTKKNKKTPVKDSRYELELDSKCKINISGYDGKYRTDIDTFNGVFDSWEEGLSYELLIKNGRVHELILYS